MSKQTQAVLVSLAAAVVAFLVVFYVAHVIVDLVVVVVSLLAAGAAGLACHNAMTGRPPGELPWRRHR
jgi:hypothetical protein